MYINRHGSLLFDVRKRLEMQQVDHNAGVEGQFNPYIHTKKHQPLLDIPLSENKTSVFFNQNYPFCKDL